MPNRTVPTILMVALTLSLLGSSLAQERDRSKIADKYKWNLADIYPNDDAWKKGKDQLVADIPKLTQFKGTLNSSPQQLLQCLDMLYGLSKTYARVYVYASMNSDQDTRESKYLAMVQETGQVGSTFGATSSFIEPEILKMDRARVDEFKKQEPKLGIYAMYLNDILRRQAHTGTEGEEKIIADAGLMSGGPQNIYSTFSNADFPYPTITLSDGKSVKQQGNVQPVPRRSQP